MENSTVNLYFKSHSAELGKEDDQNSEESGWTAYFEDFLNEQNRQQYSENRCDTSFVTNSHVVSDAASFIVEYDEPYNKEQVAACSTITSLPKFSKKLNFKKTRTKEISYDDSLEDTASSPVNSPKIMHQEKGGNDAHCFEMKTDEKRTGQLVFDGNYNNCADLRKRGLCLVPMSMLVNYLG